MLRPFNFGFYKILPILYDNYLSNTEILNEIISRFNLFINQLNEVESATNTFVDEINRLDSDYLKLSNEFAELKKESQSIVSNVEKMLEVFKSEMNDGLEAKLIAFYNDIDYKVSNISQKVNTLEFLFDKLNSEVERKMLELSQKVDSSEKRLISIVTNNYYTMRDYVNKKIASIKWDIIVTNPITQKEEPLQRVLDYMSSFFGKGLTCQEYRELNLTCEQYRMLDLTCYEYRIYGIHKKQLSKLYDFMDRRRTLDLFGKRRLEALSSAYQAFGYGVSADMNGWDISCEQYNEFSKKYTVQQMDMYGKFILSNHMTGLMRPCVYLKADTWISGTGLNEEFSIVLQMPDDLSTIVESHDLLTQRSVDLLNLNVDYEIVPETIDADETIQTYNADYSIINVKKELVDGGIAINATFINKSRVTLLKNDGSSRNVKAIHLLDAHAITTI